MDNLPTWDDTTPATEQLPTWDEAKPVSDKSSFTGEIAAPMAGAIGGGLIGSAIMPGPGTIVGSMIGAGLGRASHEMIVDKNPMVVQPALEEAAMQGVGEGAFGLAGKLIKGTVKLTPELLAKTSGLGETVLKHIFNNPEEIFNKLKNVTRFDVEDTLKAAISALEKGAPEEKAIAERILKDAQPSEALAHEILKDNKLSEQALKEGSLRISGAATEMKNTVTEAADGSVKKGKGPLYEYLITKMAYDSKNLVAPDILHSISTLPAGIGSLTMWGLFNLPTGIGTGLVLGAAKSPLVVASATGLAGKIAKNEIIKKIAKTGAAEVAGNILGKTVKPAISSVIATESTQE